MATISNENRTVTLATKVRPIKKLFIIEPEDLKRLLEIIQCISKEILGLSNLILINNDSLLSENTYNFINRHDPDVIINYSDFPDSELSKKLKTPTFSGDKIDETLKSLSTPLCVIDHLPFPWKTITEDDSKSTFTSFKNNIDNLDSLSLLKLLHYGYVDDDLQNYLKDEIFNNIHLAQIDTIEQVIDEENLLQNNLLFMMLDLAKIGEGSSVWHQDYNPNSYFKNEPTIIFGDSNNTKSMVYFWNTRATYPRNKTVWFPVELLKGKEHLLTGFTHCCNFSRKASLMSFIRKQGLIEIDSAKYYFGTYTHEWDTYEYVQNASVIDGKVKVYHPFEKLPSKSGCNVNLVLEVSGIKELHLPKSVLLGGLYVDLPDRNLFKHYFARTNKLALSLLINHFEPYSQTPVIEEIRLPESDLIFQTLFLENGLKMCATATSGMAKELVDVFGGLEGLEILSNRQIFNLIVKLTPPRIEKLVRSISSFVDNDNQDALRDLLQKNLTSLTTINSNIIASIDEISSMLPIRREERTTIFPLIEKLYEKRILLRGKYFQCPYCNSNLWYELESISKENRCLGCNRNVSIPIFSKDKVLSDSYKLNELVSQAVDQGILPLMLTVNFLSKLPYHTKRYAFNYNTFYKDTECDLLAEVDLIFTLGGMLGLSEIKADRGFVNEQIDRLLKIASILNVNLLVFSSLKERNSPEINDLYQHLLEKKLKIPAFILTQEVLFDNENMHIEHYFEINHDTGSFYEGPIIL